MRFRRDTFFHVFTGMAVLTAVTSIALGGEWYLRRTGSFSNYVERNKLSDKPQQQAEPWLWTFPPHRRWTHVSAEFSQEIRTNSLGLTGDEPVQREPGKKLVVVLGDSFTQGLGDPEGGGFVPTFSREIGWKVINGGVAGSDPIFGLRLLSERLLKFRPDVVLLVINGNDIEDLRDRGGFRSRVFDKNGYLVQAPGPWWRPLFQRSHLFRAFMMGALGYSWKMRSPAEEFKQVDEEVEDLAYTATVLKKLAAENGFRAFVVFHPMGPEMKSRQVYYNLERVMSLIEKNKIDFINLSKKLFDRVPVGEEESIFWKLDAHFNAKGYEILGRILADELRERKLAPSRP